MATLQEITTIWADDNLKVKIEAAMTVIAKEIEDEDPATTDHAKRLALAKRVYESSQSVRDEFVKAMVAANADQTLANITGASDTAIKDAVRATWNTFLE